MKKLDRLLDTIRVICSSPFVRYYRIGYTSWSADRKRGIYGRRHVVILADRLDRDSAWELEERLQAYGGIGGERPVPASVKNSLLYKMYDPKRRKNGRSYRSHGGNHAAPENAVHSVYMVWKARRIPRAVLRT
jgi:hypothetical protein